MQYQHRFTRTILCLVAASMLAGCQASEPAEKPFVVPGADSVQVSHFIGSPLSGPTAQTLAAVKASDALLVRVEFVGLESMPQGIGQQLAAKAGIIVATRRDTPLIPAIRLMRGARWVDLHRPGDLAEMISAAAGRRAVIAEPDGALPVGVTAAFVLSETTGLVDPLADEAAHRRIEVDVYRPAATGGLQLGLVIEDLAEPPIEKTDLGENLAGPPPTATPKVAIGKNAPAQAHKAAPAVIAPPTPPVFQREVAIVDLPNDSGGTAVIVPIHFSGTDASAIAAVISVHPASNAPANVAAATRCAADLQLSADAVANRPGSLTVISPVWSRYRVALDALSEPNRRRSALVYLATQTDATLCRDVALAADQPSLDRLSAAVRRAVAASASQSAADADALGWTLDRATFQMLGAELADSTLPPELMAVLVACAGQAGRDPGSIEEVSKSLATRSDFDNRLLAENFIYLEDSSLSARVRAFDWLAARGQAPPGYDPAGAPKDRRDALERFAATPAAGETK
jgi:hypothetical protein